MAFVLPATTLQAGRGYRFVLASENGPKCYLVKERTWDHNGSQVNGGSARCTEGPRVEPSSAVKGPRRLWHVQGIDDRTLSCISTTGDNGQFSPSMPTGWLVSTGGYNLFVEGGGGPDNPPPPYESICSFTKGSGDELVRWRSTPGQPALADYVCRWTQWAPLGDRIPDGWYYGLPWITARSASPRDVYLQLALDTTPPTIDLDGDLAAADGQQLQGGR